MPSQTDQQLMIQEHDAKLAAQSMTPMDLLQMAVQKGVDIDQLTKLMELQERWEANEARREFNESMAKFKANPPTITKNRHVRFETQKGVTEYDHTTLDHLVDEVTAALSDVGMSLKWEFPESSEVITVKCTLTHRRGHSESATLSGPADPSGNKNPIQARNSTVTYLERYTLFAVCGLAPRGMDNDGAGCADSKWPQMPDGWLAERLDWIANCNASDLHKTFKDAYKAAFDAGAKPAVDALVIANKQRKEKEGI